jgi:thiol-disulfide isomerase/thioredoxin
MKKIVVGVISLLGLLATAQNREIVFNEAAWEMQLATAKKVNKLIFLDAYASWCGPCKMMVKDVFTKDSVADLFNQKFVNVKYDMEKGEGVALKVKYGVRVYPSYLFVNSDGEVIHKIVGGMSVDKFMKEAENALNPEKSMFGLAKSFETSVHSEVKAVEYLNALAKAHEYEKMAEVSKIYFDGVAKPTLLEEHNWKLVVKYLKNPSSQAFAYLYANKMKLEEKYGVSEVSNYFRGVFTSSVYGIKGAYGKKSGLKEAQENSNAIRKLLMQGNDYSKPLLANLDLIDLATSNQWDKFCAKVDAVWADSDFPNNYSGKVSFVIDASNVVVAASIARQYPNVLKWADLIEKNNPELFARIQLFELRKRVLKRQGKMAESEVMSQKEKGLRKEAADKSMMVPKMIKD